MLIKHFEVTERLGIYLKYSQLYIVWLLIFSCWGGFIGSLAFLISFAIFQIQIGMDLINYQGFKHFYRFIPILLICSSLMIFKTYVNESTQVHYCIFTTPFFQSGHQFFYGKFIILF
jgi:hypothetical protein